MPRPGNLATPAPSAFAFINVSHPSGLKKHSTEIRKHVMRDIGRARSRPKTKDSAARIRSQKLSHDANPEESESKSKSNDHDVDKQVALRSKDRTAGYSPLDETNLHSFLYPKEIEEPQIQLVRNLLSQANQPRKRPLRAIWFSLMTTDLGAFHLLLASSFITEGCSVTKKDALSINFHQNSTTALAYYNKSIESVQKRLLRPDALSDDGLLIAVLSFLCFNVKIQNFDQWSVHIGGLERLVSLRGGISNLNNAYTRLLAIWKDLCGAAALDVSPRFSLSPDVMFHPADQGVVIKSRTFRYNIEQLRSKFSGFKDTIDALEFVAGVSIFITNRPTDEKFWEDDIFTARLIISSAHKVLSLARVPPEDVYLQVLTSPDIIIREVLRLSLLVFIGLLKIRSDFSKEPPGLSRSFSALKTLLSVPVVDWSSIRELKLWAFFICSLDMSGDNRDWCVSRIREEMGELKLESSASVLELVKEIIWIEDLIPGGQLRWLCAQIDGEI